MSRRNPFLALAVLLAGPGLAGTLEPPPGPIAPTMKPLSEVEARRPIRQSDLPMTITVDGAYYLAENLYATQNGVDMITVFAQHAAIDLNGFIINGTSQVAQASDCIQVEPTVQSFRLTDGVIRFCGQNGVTTNGAGDMSVTVKRVHSTNNGSAGFTFSIGSHGVISETVVASNGANGMLLADGVIEDSVAVGNAGIGFLVHRGLIRGCMARSNGLPATFTFGGTIVDSYFP